MEKVEILKKLTKNEDGILRSLNDLSTIGKKIFYCFVHLFLSSPEDIQNGNVYQKILPTFSHLNESRNIEIDRGNVLNVLSSFVSNGNSLIECTEKKVVINNEENESHKNE